MIDIFGSVDVTFEKDTDSQILSRSLKIKLLSDKDFVFKIKKRRLKYILKKYKYKENIGTICGSTVLYIYGLIDRCPTDMDIIVNKKDYLFLKDINKHMNINKYLDTVSYGKSFLIDYMKDRCTDDEVFNSSFNEDVEDINSIGAFSIANATYLDMFYIKNVNYDIYNNLHLQKVKDVIIYKLKYLEKSNREKDYEDLKMVNNRI